MTYNFILGVSELARLIVLMNGGRCGPLKDSRVSCSVSEWTGDAPQLLTISIEGNDVGPPETTQVMLSDMIMHYQKLAQEASGVET